MNSKQLGRLSFLFLTNVISLYIVGQNIALNKPYSFSEPASYSQTSSDLSNKILTDGIYTQGYFWAKQTTVGWLNKERVEITIDLKNSVPVDSVVFSTAGGTAEVYFPRHLYVFLSDDMENFAFIGDAAEKVDRKYQGYELKRISLNKINKKGRYVKIVAIPDGIFLFFDEIEVYRGIKGEKIKKSVVIQKSTLDDFVNSQKINTYRLSVIDSMVENLPENLKVKVRNLSWYKNPEHFQNTAKYECELFKFIGKHIKSTFNESLVINKQSAWGVPSPMYIPAQAEKMLNYDFLLASNKFGYGAFSITNSSNQEKIISIQDINGDNSYMEFELFNSPFVATDRNVLAADPLIKITDRIGIKSGHTVFLIFRVKGKTEGITKKTLSISAGKYQTSINITLNTVKIPELADRFNLNVNLWAELNMPVINDKIMNANQDLYDHGVNTVEVVPSVIPQDFNAREFSKTTHYISQFTGVKNVLLFIDFNSNERKLGGDKSRAYLSDRWKSDFLKWYNNIVAAIKKAGYSECNIYLFPYDEPASPEQIKDFKNFILWAKGLKSDLKFYATFQNDEAINQLFPLVDVGQINYKYLNNLPKSNCEIWTYFSSSDRLASPYTEYRLLAWEAFIKGYKGLGFWNYADNGKGFLEKNSIDDAAIPPGRNFSVIYSGPNNSIISTRRWEAFKTGLEDYDLLSLYSLYFGKDSALKKAELVFNNPDNLLLADKVRLEITEGLNEKLKSGKK